MDYLQAYYNEYDEDSRLLSKHGRVEYLTTMRYIEKYLKKGDRVLEIGAGTGRYSHALARMGYRVHAVELVPHNIEIFLKNQEPGEDISIAQGNALDLSAFEDETYDLTLLLGPMYHLYETAPQRRALAEALRVTKTGGVAFAAYCGNDATIVQFGFMRNQILNEPWKSLIDPVTFKAASTPKEIFQMYRKEDVDALMRGLPAERLHYVGTDTATNYMRDTVDAMNEETYAAYLRYHFYICERADMVGLSHHMLDIFRKTTGAQGAFCNA